MFPQMKRQQKERSRSAKDRAVAGECFCAIFGQAELADNLDGFALTVFATFADPEWSERYYGTTILGTSLELAVESADIFAALRIGRNLCKLVTKIQGGESVENYSNTEAHAIPHSHQQGHAMPESRASFLS
jgi:hypothetical protein